MTGLPPRRESDAICEWLVGGVGSQPLSRRFKKNNRRALSKAYYCLERIGSSWTKGGF
jgi:hypothetical protein